MLRVAEVSFQPSDMFQRRAAAIVEQIAELVRRAVPDCDVQDMGATAVPGLLTKGDVDVNVRVAAIDFPAVIEFLERHFSVHQPQNWSDGYASFADDYSYALPTGVQVTIVGHPDDKFLAQRDRLAADPKLIALYNELKREHDGGTMEGYRSAKWAFIATHLAAD